MTINKNHPIYLSKSVALKCRKKHVALLLIRAEEKRHYGFIKDFSTFMYDHTLHCGRKHFSRFRLQAFSTKEILKCSIKNC